MNHAITIGTLVFTLGIGAGLLAMAFGVLSFFGNMMADTQGDGGKQGCTFFVVGLAVVVAIVIAWVT